MLPQWFKDYLSFHRTERNGIIVLVIILIALIAFNFYQRFFWQGDWEEMQLKYGPMIVQFQEETDSISQEKESPQPWIPKTRELFNFDPNTLDSSGWVTLGFSPKQSAAILRYRSAGAKFRKAEDLKKLFVVDDERYEELEPFIDIQPISEEVIPPKYDEKPKWEKPKYEAVTVELNGADSAQLVKLKGIGPSYAKRIMKYRELLGGYISKEQLLEVYGMDSARFIPIMEHIQVDVTIRTRLNVNTAEVKELLRHPYIDLNLAKAIVNYREQHGKYRSLEDLKKIKILNEKDYIRISAYLKVE